MNLLCKINTVAKYEEVKTGSSLAEPSKEGCDLKWAGLPMMMIMIIRITSPHQLEDIFHQISWKGDHESLVGKDLEGSCRNLFQDEECRLLGCGAVWVYYKPTFRRNVSPQNSG
jgi:hypothetical protein